MPPEAGAFIDISKNDSGYLLVFTNDGAPPQGKIEERGGLKNLRRQTEALNGIMELEWKNGFKMIITLPGYDN